MRKGGDRIEEGKWGPEWGSSRKCKKGETEKPEKRAGACFTDN